jgi:CheY-like chemotaxis protein
MKGLPTLAADGARDTLLQSQTNPRPHILVAEDDVLVRRISAIVLSRSGYEVDAVGDGAAAWEALSTGSFDLLITDNEMPRLSGVELIEKVRSAGMVLRVILATGILPKEALSRCPWLKPAATLLKPFTAEEMLRTVEKVLDETVGVAAAPECFSIVT